jgi:hypothetical protein
MRLWSAGVSPPSDSQAPSRRDACATISSWPRARDDARWRGVSIFAFYVVVVTLGILSMGFQLLASRLLGPEFGSGIDVWACLISTFLAAFSTGSMVGGWVSNLRDGLRGRWQLGLAFLAVAMLALTAVAGRSLVQSIAIAMEPGQTPILLACVAVFFFPVAALSCFTPQCVQFLASLGTPPGKASGLVYGVSTLGNIAGVMLTAFVLIPNFRVSTLLFIWFGVALVSLAALLRLLRAPSPSRS